MNNNNCHYCDNFLLLEIKLVELNSLRINVYYCSQCDVDYLCLNDKLVSVSIYTTINNNIFRYTVSLNGKSQLCKVQEQYKHSRNITKDKIILRFENAKDITPENFKEKLQHWLIFL
jgi:hypothetical protein